MIGLIIFLVWLVLAVPIVAAAYYDERCYDERQAKKQHDQDS